MRTLSLAALLALLAATPAATALAPLPNRFAFDQIELVMSDFGPTPVKFVDSPPGSFERDYRWSVAGTSDRNHRDSQRQSIAYFDGWTRVRTFKPYEAVIQFANGAKHTVLMANTYSRTYKRYEGRSADALLSPPVPRATPPQPTRKYTGTEQVRFTDRDSVLPVRFFDGLPAEGRRITSTRTATGTGSCALRRGETAGALVSITDEYRGNFPEPPAPFLRIFHDELIATSDCLTSIVQPIEPQSQKEFDRRFLLYSRTAACSGGEGKMRLAFVHVIERGHIRNLTARDWQALQLPRGYSKKR